MSAAAPNVDTQTGEIKTTVPRAQEAQTARKPEETGLSHIPKEFVVERQGKKFVLYAGLLHGAHARGLISINTELIQIPREENNRVAIVKAVVTLCRDGVMQTFEGLGDAAPNNVAPAMQTCLIRMAETRGKARALRDAIDVGVAALEEGITEDDERAPVPRANQTQQPAARSDSRRQERPVQRETRQAAQRTQSETSTEGEILQSQRQAIISICNSKSWTVPDFTGWSAAEASEWIKEAQQKKRQAAS